MIFPHTYRSPMPSTYTSSGELGKNKQTWISCHRQGQPMPSTFLQRRLELALSCVLLFSPGQVHVRQPLGLPQRCHLQRLRRGGRGGLALHRRHQGQRSAGRHQFLQLGTFENPFLGGMVKRGQQKKATTSVLRPTLLGICGSTGTPQISGAQDMGLPTVRTVWPYEEVAVGCIRLL